MLVGVHHVYGLLCSIQEIPLTLTQVCSAHLLTLRDLLIFSITDAVDGGGCSAMVHVDVDESTFPCVHSKVQWGNC